MADRTTAGSGPGRLHWQAQGGYQVATGGTCYYVREGVGSMVAGGVFATVFALGGLGYGGRLLLTETEWSARGFGALCLGVGALFACVLGATARRGRWMVVYDRGGGGGGGPGAAGEIRVRGKRLPVERVRCLSTRVVGTSLVSPERTVVAELHDGTFELLGPSGTLTWPDHWGQQAATWMGLPYRRSRE